MMFLKVSPSFHCQKGLVGFLLLVALLSACSPSQAPLQITDISVSPDPVIGQTATLHIEVMSTWNEPEATILIDLPPGVKLMEGDLIWEGSLTANQPQSHEVAIGVLYEGDWRLWLSTRSQTVENSSYGEQETLHIITTANSVRVVPGGAYRITQPPDGMVAFPSPLPETPPENICP